jgi:hypothetical protein
MVFFRELHLFLQHSWIGHWNKMSLSPPWKLWFEGYIQFKN